MTSRKRHPFVVSRKEGATAVLVPFSEVGTSHMTLNQLRLDAHPSGELEQGKKYYIHVTLTNADTGQKVELDIEA